MDLGNILTALCSRVEELPGNDSWHVFVLGDAKEARLANDLLYAQGFEVKFYPDAGGAKLYISRASSTSTANLASARAYANTLKSIKNSIDSLSGEAASGIGDYTLGLTRTPTGGRQISIFMSPPAGAIMQTPAPAVNVAAPRPVTSAPAVAAAAAQSKFAIKVKEAGLHDGPSVAKKYPFATEADGSSESGGLARWISKIFVRDIASNGVLILFMIAFGLGLISFVVMSKGFLCPDLATVKKNVWYCRSPQ